MLRKLFLIVSLFLMMTGMAAGFSVSELQLGILERTTLNISISNPLSVEDEVHLSFKGEGAQKLVDWEIEDSPGVVCGPGDLRCNVTVDPGSKFNVPITFEGKSVGRGVFVAQAVSSGTELVGEAKLDLNTRPRTEEGPVSAPALTMPYLILLLLLASTYFYISLRRRR